MPEDRPSRVLLPGAELLLSFSRYRLSKRVLILKSLFLQTLTLSEGPLWSGAALPKSIPAKPHMLPGKGLVWRGREVSIRSPTVVFWHETCRWHLACSKGKGPSTNTPSGEGRALNWLHWDLKEKWIPPPWSSFSSFQTCCCVCWAALPHKPSKKLAVIFGGRGRT